MENKAKILIADDSVTIRKLIEMVLSSEGYQLFFVDNGLDLIKEAFRVSPDLIISDVTMPIMNGYQACSFIKSQEMLRSIPVILLTAKSEKSDKFWGQKTGADTYITKPFQPEHLKSVVKEFLENSNSPKEKISIDYTTEELLGYINDLFDKKMYQMTVLNEISNLGSYIEDFHELLKELFKTIGKVVEYENIFIFLDESEETYFYKGLSQTELNRLQLKLSDYYKEISLKKVIFLESDTTEGWENVYVDKLTIRGERIGFIGVLLKKGDISSVEESLGMLVGQVSLLVDNGNLYSKVKNYAETKAQSLAMVNEVGKMMASLTDVDKLLKMVVHLGVNVSNANGGILLLYEKDFNFLRKKFVLEKDFFSDKDIYKIGEGLSGKIFLSNESIIANSILEFANDLKDDVFKLETLRNFIIVPLKFRGKSLGVLSVVNKRGDVGFNNEDVEILNTLANQIAIALNNAMLYASTQELFLSTVDSLSSAIDAKDRYTHGHSRRVTEFSLEIAKCLELPESFLSVVQLSGLLHDIGKIGIPEAILCKPSRLTDEEYMEIKKHPLIGAKIMEPIKPLRKVIPGMKYHHERWDGKGYPEGLKGEEIPLIARIIGVADTFDAMTSNRSYRKGLDPQIAYEEINRCSGSQFDPSVVEAFNKAYKKKEFFDILEK